MNSFGFRQKDRNSDIGDGDGGGKNVSVNAIDSRTWLLGF